MNRLFVLVGLAVGSFVLADTASAGWGGGCCGSQCNSCCAPAATCCAPTASCCAPAAPSCCAPAATAPATTPAPAPNAAAPAPQARVDGQTYRSFSADPAPATMAPAPMYYSTPYSYAPARTRVPDSSFPADRKFRGRTN